MDPMFPELPEDLAALSDEELSALLTEHQTAAEMIDAEDEEFTKGLSAEEVTEQYEKGVEQIEAIVAEQKRRTEAEKTYLAKKDELKARREAALAAESEGEGDGDAEPDGGDGDASGEGEGDGEGEGEAEHLAAEADPPEGDGDGDGSGDGEGEGEEVAPEATPVATAAVTPPVQKTVLRRPPAPSAEREAKGAPVAPLIAAAGLSGVRGGKTLDRGTLADTLKKLAQSLGAPVKTEGGLEQRFHVAQAQFQYPPERTLAPGELDLNVDKIRKVIPAGIAGVPGNMALVASGGLCAPLEPIYTMPNFASQARPVRDGLPSFQAERGGVNVPTATIIGDITTAISVITEAEDALGGTFATKSCQDLDCPSFVETAVTVLAHCREYGNLNARAWPEKIAHENDLTMAAHARTADGYLLDQIKALSIELTTSKVINAYADLVRALMQARSAIVNVLRMDSGVIFRIMAPEWLPNLLAADVASTQFDRFQTQAAMTAHLTSLGFAPTWYKDAVTGGDSQMFASASAGVLNPFPDSAQIALFPEGEFIHVDAGTLDLGLVRDSSLNSTNDFQVFGETFENVARLGPAQAAYWLEVDLCPSGEFPALATAYAC